MGKCCLLAHSQAQTYLAFLYSLRLPKVMLFTVDLPFLHNLTTKTTPADMLTGQSDLESSSIAPPFQVNLGCVNLTIEIN